MTLEFYLDYDDTLYARLHYVDEYNYEWELIVKDGFEDRFEVFEDWINIIHAKYKIYEEIIGHISIDTLNLWRDLHDEEFRETFVYCRGQDRKKRFIKTGRPSIISQLFRMKGLDPRLGRSVAKNITGRSPIRGGSKRRRRT